MFKILEKKIETLQRNTLVLEEKLLKYEQERLSFEEKYANLLLEHDVLIQAYLQAQRDLFGRKTERFVDSENPQLPLFPDTQPETEPGESADAEPAPSDVEEIIYTRTKNKGSKNKNSDIPTREVVLPVPEAQRICSCCGKPKEVIGYETNSKLHHKPAEYEMLITKREKMACRFGCEKQTVTAPLVPQILPRCRVTESVLAYICISKVLDRQPLYHLEQSIVQRHHWHISRQSMARWMIELSEKLQPLINLMKERLQAKRVCRN